MLRRQQVSRVGRDNLGIPTKKKEKKINNSPFELLHTHTHTVCAT